MNRRDDFQIRIVTLAEAILAGRVGVIEGARQLVALRSEVTDDALDDDFIPFIAIDSETDTLPVSEVRRLWAPDALLAKDREIDRARSL